MTRLEVDKTVQTLKAFDRDDKLVAFIRSPPAARRNLHRAAG